MKIHATEAKLTKPSNNARKVILEEMLKYPEQLANDIKRQWKINVMLKNSVPTDVLALTRGKPLMDIYEAIATRLNQIYVSETDNPTPKNKLGKFYMAEVLYPMVQNFNSASLIKYTEEQPKLSSWQTNPQSHNTKLWTDFIYDTDKQILSVVANSENELVDTTGKDKSTKKLLLQSTASFDLDAGKVNLKFSYSIDGQKKEWEDNDPFSKNLSFLNKLKNMFQEK